MKNQEMEGARGQYGGIQTRGCEDDVMCPAGSWGKQ